MADNTLDDAFNQVYGASAAPAAPPTPQDAPPVAAGTDTPVPAKSLDDAFKDVYGDSSQSGSEAALRASMMQAKQMVPDTAAKALPLAQAAGIPLDTAARNLSTLQKDADFNSVDYKTLYKNYPQLAGFLSDPNNASVAHDDIPALQSLSDWAGAQKSMMEDPLNPLSHMAALGSGTAKSIGQVMEFAGQGLQNLSKDQGSPEDAVDRFLISGRQAIEGGIGSTLSFSGQSWSTLGDIIDAPQQDFIHNIERFAGMLPPVMAVAAANPAAVGPVFGAMMGGQVYQKAKAMGLDLNSTKVNAAAVAAFGVGTLLGPAGKMALSAIPEGASIGLRNVADAIATKIGAAPGTATADALARTGNYAAHIVGTTAAMAGYTLAQNAIYRKMLGDEKTDFTTGLPDSMTMGGFAGLVGAIMDHGMALTKNYHDTVSVPAMTRESLAQGGQLMQESKTFGRSPETANAYLNQELGNNDLHVRPAAFQTFFQKIDPDAQKAILAKMPELADDLQDSLKTGEDLKVNQADYHSYIQPHAPELDQWMRLRPETWSEGDRHSYEQMMQEIIPADEGNGENSVHNNLYNQLIQRYGQRTAPTGIPDIADSLGAWLQNSHDTLMAKYGHIPGAADFLHSMIGNMKILREYPELGAHMMKDPSFDTFIDKVRNEQVKGAAPPKMRTVTGKDGIEKQVAVKPRGQRSPTPIIDYLASKGGVRRGSDLEKDLSGRGITRSTMAKLFNKMEPPDENQGSFIRGKVAHNQDKYGLRNFDEINARELEGSAGHSTRDRENADFVDKEWLLEQVENEVNGEGQVDEAQAHHDAAAEDMLNALDHEGVDITKATNEQVKAAIDRAAKNYAAEQSMPFFQKGDNGSLVAVHNLTEGNLQHADKMGGIAAPSLAIHKGEHQFPNFGEVGLIAGRDLIDPRLNKSSKVFGSDAYSPRYPEVEHMLREKEFNNLIKDLQKYLPEGMPKHDNYLMLPDPNDLSRDGIGKLENSGAFAAKFLTENGIKLPKSKTYDDGGFYASGTAREYVKAAQKHPEYAKYVRDQFEKMVEKERIFNGFTDRGNRRYLPHDLNTVVKLMTRNLRDGEGFNYGVGSIRSKVSAQFKSIKDIKASEDKLLSKADFDKVKKDVDNEFTDLADYAREYSTMDKKSFGFLDAFSEHLKEIADGIPVSRVLQEYYKDAPPELGVKMADFLNKLHNMPTEYFEVKLKRAVGINEFSGAVIPSDSSPETLAILQKHGITHIETYDRNNNESRAAAVQKFKDKTFFQGGDDGPRGSVTFGPDNETTVRLFSRERLDTLLHEFGHIYWRALSKIAELPGGEEAAKDVAAMKDWVTKDPDYLHKYVTKYNPYKVAKTETGYEIRNNGKTVADMPFQSEAAAEAKSKALYADLLKEYEDKGGAEWLKTQKYGVAETDLERHAQTAMEEKLADSFLSYLKTGKSPSVDLIPTFDKFQSWLGRLYDGVKDTLPKINPEVKDVFDRMFATSEQIHAMRNQPEFSPDPSLMAVLNKPDRERYARQYDRMISEAQNRLLREALRQSERAGNKAYKEARAGIKDEMQSTADGQRRYQAIDTIIKTGGLDKKDLVNEYGKEILPYLDKHGLVAKKGGVRPGPIATIHGYDSARDMITDFMNTPKKKDYVKDQTDQEMIARHGDMLHDGTIEREAVAAYHNNLRAEALGWEMKKMAAMAKMPAPSPEAIKAKAYTMLGDRVLSTVRPYSFYRAEVRAAHEVGKALAKKDYAAAAVAKGKQLLNHHLYKMAADAKESQNRSMDKWSDILRRPDKKLAKGYDIDFIYAARKILGDHDFATGGNFQDLNTWQQRLLEVDPDAAKNIQDILFAAATSDNKPVNKMTWNEFQGLRDSINGLIEQAKGQNTLEIEGRKIEKKEVRATLIDGPLTGKTLADGTPVRAGGLADMDPVMDFDDLRHQSEGRKDKAKKALLGGAMHFMRMEKWVEAMDGGKFDGPIRQLIYQPVRKALDNYLSKTNDNLQIARDILGHVDLLGDQIKAPELKVYDKTGEPINGGKGYTFANKGELIGALVHHGNGFDPGSNGYKLVRGNGWHQADWQAFLDRAMQDGTITKVDMDTVQKLWDMMDGMRPDIWRAHKDMYGFYPKEIASVPFQTPFGEYKGGYWPVKYDPAKDDHLAAAYEKDALTSDSRHAWPTTGKSSTMDRDPSFSRPIQMKLEFLPAHIDWAMRFAHLEPAVREAAKIMFDPEIRKAIDRVNPRVRENVILPWLKRTVRQDMDLSSGGTMREFSGVTNFIKDSFYMKTLGLNLRYPLQRVGEIGPIAHDTSWSSVMRAFGDLVRDNEGTRGEISQSPFMHTRAIWFEDNAAKQLRNLIVDRNPYEKIADFSKAHAFYTVRETHRWLDEIQWLASKYHALEGKADGVNPDNMQQVMDYADSRVRGSQATFGPGDVSDIEGGSAGLRAVWNIFYSVMNTKLNAALADARLVLGKDTPIPVRAVGLASVFINRLMIPMFISDSIMRLINTLGPTDQKGHHSVLAWAESAAFDGIKSVASLVPLGSAAADQLLPLFKDIGDKAYNDTLSIAPAAQMMFKDVFENMPKHLYEAIFHNGSKQKAFDSLFTAAGDLLRVPFTPVKRAIDYGAAVHQGKQHPDNGLEMVRGILGGPNIKK